MNYLLPCTACGSKIPVSTGQAGQSLRCGTCGAEFEVPSIRELRSLQVAANAPTAAPAWERRQGLIFLGGAIALLALAGVALLEVLKPALIDVSAVIGEVNSAAVTDEIKSVTPDENYMRYESVRPWPPELFAERFKAEKIPFYMTPSANLLIAFESGGTQYLAPAQTRPLMHKAQTVAIQNMQFRDKRRRLGEWMLILAVAGGIGVAIAVAGLLVPTSRPQSRKPLQSMKG
jgi:hypothetical protein